MSGDLYAKTNSNCQLVLNNEVCANITFKNLINRKTDAEFEIFFTDSNGETIALDKLPQIKLWMIMKGGHGHGSDEVKIKKNGEKFHVSNVWFLMLGKWQIKISGEYKGKRFAGEPDICIRKDSTKTAFGACK